MSQPIHFVDISGNERVIASLASTIEQGFTALARRTAGETAFSTCNCIERTDLAALLQASSSPLIAMEIAFGAGLQGKALVVMRLREFHLLGEQITGIEARNDEWPPAEILKGCTDFVINAMKVSDRQFTDIHGKSVVAGEPDLVHSSNLPRLQDAYQSALCITYQLTFNSDLNISVQVLTQPSLLASLTKLLNESVSGSEPESSASQRPARPMENKTMSEMPLEAGNPAPHRGGEQAAGSQGNWNIDLLLDVELPLVVSFGETVMPLKDVLKLGVGSVIALEKTVNDPVTLIVNQKPIARGEVVMVEGNYGIRILEVESTADRIRSLG